MNTKCDIIDDDYNPACASWWKACRQGRTFIVEHYSILICFTLVRLTCLLQDGIVNGYEYTCSCVAGYTGKRCGVDIDECATAPCESTNCSVCDPIHVVMITRYLLHIGSNQWLHCSCDNGWIQWSGENCDVNIDDCNPNPCQHGGHCTVSQSHVVT